MLELHILFLLVRVAQEAWPIFAQQIELSKHLVDGVLAKDSQVYIDSLDRFAAPRRQDRLTTQDAKLFADGQALVRREVRFSDPLFD